VFIRTTHNDEIFAFNSKINKTKIKPIQSIQFITLSKIIP